MSERICLLCPGQGAQVISMGRAWYEKSPIAREVFAEADEILRDAVGGAKLSDLCFNGPSEQLNRTDICQPAIYAVSVSCWRSLASELGDVPIVATAGLSLGEYTALHLAGVFSFADGLGLVAQRGRFMQEAAEESQGSMVVLIGADESAAETVCREAGEGEELVCANFNAPGQIVLSGTAAACERAVSRAAEAGIRASRLVVAGAFHSQLMAPAGRRMADALEAVEFRPPTCCVMSNVTGKPHDPEDAERIKELLVAQITSPVRWSESCRWLNANIAGECHELAPGKVLSGLMRRIDRDIKVVNHDQPTK